MTPAIIRKVCVVADCASQRLACPRLVMKLLTFSNIQGILKRNKTAVKALNFRDLNIFVLDFSAFLPPVQAQDHLVWGTMHFHCEENPEL